MALRRGYRAIYIDWSLQSELLDQTDLKDGVDAILGGGRESFWKLTGGGPPGRPGGTMVGPGDQTWQPLGVCLRGFPLEVLWSLLE
jgi:hypothetical protein